MECAVDVAADLKAGRLDEVLPGWSDDEQPIVAIFRSGRHVPRKITVFVEAMEEAFSTSTSEREDASTQTHQDQRSRLPRAAQGW